jgi:stage II sporulation protein R
MFPPLCFIDITKGEVSYKETEKAMKKVLSEKEYSAVDNTEIKEEKEDKIVIKFKLVELFDKFFRK